jgi:hypothetical protein
LRPNKYTYFPPCPAARLLLALLFGATAFAFAADEDFAGDFFAADFRACCFFAISTAYSV